MKISIGSLILIILFDSCVVRKSDVESKLLFQKNSINISKNNAESDWIEFDINLFLSESKNLYIPFDLLSFTCCYNIIKSDSIYQKDIESLKDVKSNFPVFIIENSKGNFKYFLKSRFYDKTLMYKGSEIIEPIRSDINPCNGIGVLDKKKFRFQKGMHHLGSYNIYEYDLKIHESDSIVRLHYMYRKNLISSNWIKID